MTTAQEPKLRSYIHRLILFCYFAAFQFVIPAHAVDKKERLEESCFPYFTRVTVESKWIPTLLDGKLTYLEGHKVIVKTQLTKVVCADRFSDGLALFTYQPTHDQETAYIDKFGRIRLSRGKDVRAGRFSEGLTWQIDRSSGLVGFIDKTGKAAISPMFALPAPYLLEKEPSVEDTYIFSEGLSPAYENNSSCKCGYIDRTGKFVIPPTYLQCFPFKDGQARVRLDKHAWRFLDKTGAFAIKSTYENARDFSEGVAAVQEHKTAMGYINPKGDYVIRPRFYLAFDFQEGLAPTKESYSSDYGYISKHGTWAIPPAYSVASPFRDGRANVDRIDSDWTGKHFCTHMQIDQRGNVLHSFPPIPLSY